MRISIILKANIASGRPNIPNEKKFRRLIKKARNIGTPIAR
ncbi:unnamed protein product [marine sediment metagenome]|uniref:Uncharacterized protein n=1 Tax=marine sediment metagenome TaxID=412755 RepID=X1BSI6_9ZZZZ